MMILHNSLFVFFSANFRTLERVSERDHSKSLHVDQLNLRLQLPFVFSCFRNEADARVKGPIGLHNRRVINLITRHFYCLLRLRSGIIYSQNEGSRARWVLYGNISNGFDSSS